jgi:hypothetical protein
MTTIPNPLTKNSMHAINYGCGLSLNTIFSDELKPFMLTRGLNITVRNSFTGKHLESK